MAIGKPVAFDASAETRDTRGFISITTMRPVVGIDGELDVRATGLDADLADARERRIAHLLVFDVGQRLRGATVIESPVCTPIGSTFSIEQMITQLSARSRITSSSYSFHPTIDSSIRISLIGLASSPSGHALELLLGVGDAAARAAEV